MSDSFYLEGVEHIAAADAAAMSGLTRDYIGRLCREEKLTGRRIGKQWYVSTASLKRFLIEQEYAKAARREELSEERVTEYKTKLTEAAAPVAAEKIDVTERLREALARGAGADTSKTLTNPGVAHATISNLHVPAHVVTTVAEIAHKLVALTLALMLTFGTYSLVDPQYAYAAFAALRTSAAHVESAALAVVTHQATHSDMNVATTSAQTAAAATGSTPLQSAARTFSATIDSLVYSIAFPFSSRSQSVAGGTSDGTVVVRIVPVTMPVTTATRQTSPVQKPVVTSAASNTSTKTIIQRVVETQRILTQGGISAEVLDQRLAELDSRLSARIAQVQTANSTQAIKIYQALSGSSTSGGTTINNITGTSDAGSLTGILPIAHGGTGTSSAPTYGKVLVGNDAGGYDLVATSSLGIAGTGGVGTPGGSAGQIQFNDYGVLGGNPNFTLSTSTGELSATGAIFSRATTTNLYATNVQISNLTGPLQATGGIMSATSSISVAYGGTGTSTAPSYGKLLLGNGAGGYDLVSTSSLGISSGGGTWGSITGTLSSQTDLQNALDAKLSLSNWYGTTTTALAEGSNLYFTTARATTSFIGNLAATTSVASITNLPNLFLPATQLSGFGVPFYQFLAATTTDALAQGTTNKYYSSALFAADLAATTSVNSIIALNNLVITAGQVSNFNTSVNSYINSSTTIPKTYTANTFTNTNTFNGQTNLSYASSTGISTGYASTSNLTVSSVPNAIFVGSNNGTVTAYTGTSCTNQFVRSINGAGVATCATVQNSDLANSSITINGASVSLGASITVSSTTLLSDSNRFTGANTFAGNTTLTNATSSAFAITNLSNTLVKANSSGSLIPAVAGTDYLTSGTGISSIAQTYGSAQNGAITLATSSAVTSNGVTVSSAITNTGSTFTWNPIVSVANIPNVALQNSSITVNGTSISLGASQTITAASSTLLSDSNRFTGANTFATLPILGSLNGLVGANGGSLYQISTTSMNASITGQAGSVANNVTFNNGGSGAASGSTFNGSGALTISYNTIGAQAAGNYLTALGSGFSTTTFTAITFSTSTLSFNGLTAGNTITASNGALTITPTWTGTLNNSGLTNSTISGISLGSNLANLTAANGTLTFSGSYNGGTAQTVALNLGNANTWTALQTFTNASSTFFSSVYASSTNAFFGNLSVANLSGVLKATAGTVSTAIAGVDYVSGGRDWNVLFGALTPTTTLGVLVNASSTIGNGTQGGGLTIAGGATTTGNARINGSLSLGTALSETNGGTGQNSYTTGDILYASGPNTLSRLGIGSPGTVLKVAAGIPSWGTDLTTGGFGGAGAWSTTTDSLAVYPTNTSNVIIVGAGSTSTPNSIFEVAGKSYFSNWVGIATTSAGSLLSVGGVANFAPAGSTIYSALTLGSLTATSSFVASGNTTLTNATSSAFAITNLSNTLVYANANGSLGAIATSSLGLPQFSDLANYLSLAAWYSTTTDQLKEGTNNVYFTTARATTSFIGNLAATTSVNSITTLNNLSITSSQVSNFNTSVNSYINSSTTIPKTYTANTFTNLQTFGNASSTGFSTTYASSTNLSVGTLSIANLSGFLKATAGAVSTSLISLTSDISGVLGVTNGGTGWSSIQSGALVYGNGSSQLATTSAGTAGQVLALLNGVPTWTSTTTFGTGLSYSAGNVTNTGVLAVGPLNQTTNGTATFATSTTGSDFTITGSGSTITFNIPSASASNRGLLSSADWSTFAGKISSSSLSASFPLAYNSGTGAFTFNGLSTSSAAVIGNIPYFSGANTFANVATTSLAAGNSTLTVTGTLGALVGGSNSTIALNLGNANTWTALQTFNYSSSTIYSSFATASTTNLFAGSATTSNLSITAIGAGNILKTTTGGYVIPAIAGTDYANFAYPFPSGATTTALSFGALTFTNATGTNIFANALTGNLLRIGSTATTTIDSAGNVAVAGTLNVTGNTLLANSTSTNEFTQGLSANTARFGQTATSSFASNGALTLATALTATNGGTGLSTIASSSILIGGAGNTWLQMATSSLGLQPAGTYLTALGSGFSTTTLTAITFSTSTLSFNGLTAGNTITASNGALTITPTWTGTLNNSGLTNSTISGISLGSNLANLTAANGTLTFSGSYNGGTAQTVALNLGNANTWTALQTFNYSSSTIYSSFATASTTNLFAGSATTSNFSITGIGAGNILKTTTGGYVVPAIAGTDYANFAYPFPSAATSTIVNFSTGLLANQIGIGTTTPFASLQIATTTGKNLVLTDPSAATGNKHWIFSSAQGTLSISTTTDTYATTTSGPVALFTQNGYFSLGNSNPGAALSVQVPNSATALAEFSKRQTGTGGAYIPFYGGASGGTVRGYFGFTRSSSGGDTFWGTGELDNAMALSSAGPIQFGSGNTLAMTIDSSQNVGIGTNNPSGFKLNVNGTANISGNTTLAAATSSSLAVTNLANTLLYANASGSIIPVATSSLGLPTFAYLFPNNATTTGLGIYGSSTIGNGTQAGGLTISGGATTTGQAYFAGNLGIGSTTPWAKLSVFAGGDYAATAASTLFAIGSTTAGTATSTLFSVNSTGSTTLFQLPSSVLKTNANGTIVAAVAGTDYLAPSSLSASFPLAYNSGTGAFSFNGLSTSSAAVIGNIPYFSGANTFANVATTSLAAGNSTLTVTGTFGALVGGSNSTIALNLGNANTWTALQNFTNASSTLFSSTYASSTNLFAGSATTSNLSITGIGAGDILKTTTGGYVVPAIAGVDYVSGGRDWNVTFGALAPTTTLGILVTASSTIGNGTQAGGLTISGGATTTGNAYFAGNVGVRTNAPGVPLDVVGSNGIRVSNTLGATFGTLVFGNDTSRSVTGNSAELQINTTLTDLRFMSTGGTNQLESSAADGSTVLNLTARTTHTSGNLLQIYNGGTATTPLVAVNYAGNMGLGTTTPWTKLAIHARNGETNTTLFAIASSTASATSTLFSVSNIGSTTLFQLPSSILKTNANGTIVAATPGTDYANFAYMFSGTTNFGATANSTSTALWLQAGLQASSTAQLMDINSYGVFNFASTSAFASTTLIALKNQPFLTASSTLTSTGLGNLALGRLTTGTNDTAFGSSALLVNTTGGDNIAVGASALSLVSSGSRNIGIGSSVVGGNLNETIAIGHNAMANVSSGNDNIAVGVNALKGSVGGSFNTIMGHYALQTTGFAGSNNVALGGFALGSLAGTSLSNNVAIGYGAGSNVVGSTNASNNIFIGNMVGATTTNVSNFLNIGNLIYGYGVYGGSSTSSAPTTGTIGVGTTSPWARFSIHANNGDTNSTLFAIASSTASATSTLFSVSNTGSTTLFQIPSSVLKTDANGTIVAAVAGTDYANFTYPFPSAATSTLLTLSGGLITTNATATSVFAQNGLFNIFSAGQTGTTTITSAGLLGVGTTSPAARLAVNSVAGDAFSLWVGSTTSPWLRVSNSGFGTTTVSGFSINGSATSTSNVGFNLTGGCFAIGGTCISGGGGSGTVSSGLQGQFAFYNTAGTAVSGTSTIFVTQASMVGVGTTTSPWNFEVAGTRPTFALSDSSAAANLKHWLFSSMGGNLYIGTSTDAYATSSPSVLSLLNAGQVGIGTSTPFRKLSVTDTVANAQVAIAYDASRYTQMQTDSTGGFHVNPSSGNNGVQLDDANLLVCSGGSCPTGLPAGTGSLVVENNVGIGTSTPAWNLEIAGTRPNLAISDTSAGTNSKHWLFSSQGGNLYVGTTTDVYATSSPAIISLLNAGNMGLGTSTPWSKLTVGAKGAITTVENQLTDAGTITVSWKDGNQQVVTLGGNRTINFTNYVAGQLMRLVVCQDDTGSRTVTWDSNVLWSGGTAPTLTTTASKCDVASFIATGATSTLKVLGTTVLNF